MRTSRSGLPEAGPDSWALVTGATSGIGAAFARELGRRGFRLILTGRRETELRAVGSEIGEERVELLLAELSEERDLERVLRSAEGRAIDVLINNAGFGIGKRFHRGDLKEEIRMARVHVEAPMRLIHAVAPGMVERGRGLIVNVASLAAFAPLPGSATYSATKAFLVAFSESLAMELGSSGVRVQALCPGFVRTHFHSGLRMPERVLRGGFFLRWSTPEAVVRASLRALGGRKVVCIPGFGNRFLRGVLALVPRALYYRVLTGAKLA